MNRAHPGGRSGNALAFRGWGPLLLGLVGSTVGTAAVLLSERILVGALVLGLCLVLLLILAQLRYRLHYTLILVIASTTIAREKLGLPIEFDAIAVALLTVVLLLSRPTQVFRRRVYVLWVPMVGYLGCNLVSSYLNSPIPDRSLRQAFVLAYRGFTFYLIVTAALKNPALRARYPVYLQWLLLFHTTISLLALYVLPKSLSLVLRQRPMGGVSVSGLFQEPNLFGVFALCVLALTLSMSVWESRKRRVRMSSVVAIGLVGLLFSYTRSTWLGLGVVVVCLGTLIGFRSPSYVRQRYVRLMSGLGLVLSACLAVLFLGAGLSASSSASSVYLADRVTTIVDAKSSTAVLRLSAWNRGFRLWQNSPWLGRGLLSYAANSGTASGWLYNFLLQSLHDSGILGTFFLIWLYAGCLYYPWRAYRLASSERDKGMLLGYVLAQLALYFTSLFSAFTWSAFAWVLLGLSTGHSLIIMRQAQVCRNSGESPKATVSLV
jgi:hypothetical protein